MLFPGAQELLILMLIVLIFSDLCLQRCLELHPDLGNLLLELKDLGLVARTDYEELLTNLSRMEVLLNTVLLREGFKKKT